ncbi:hypothetical protein ES703_41084 [subsurface metagenome]
MPEELKVALLGCYRQLPVPLVDVGAVVVVEEVVLAHGAHIGEQSLADVHSELLEGESLPLCSGLNDLGIDGVLVAVI